MNSSFDTSGFDAVEGEEFFDFTDTSLQPNSEALEENDDLNADTFGDVGPLSDEWERNHSELARMHEQFRLALGQEDTQDDEEARLDSHLTSVFQMALDDDGDSYHYSDVVSVSTDYDVPETQPIVMPPAPSMEEQVRVRGVMSLEELEAKLAGAPSGGQNVASSVQQPVGPGPQHVAAYPRPPMMQQPAPGMQMTPAQMAHYRQQMMMMQAGRPPMPFAAPPPHFAMPPGMRPMMPPPPYPHPPPPGHPSMPMPMPMPTNMHMNMNAPRMPRPPMIPPVPLTKLHKRLIVEKNITNPFARPHWALPRRPHPGVMTSYELDLVIRIQLSQVTFSNSYMDDHYFQIMRHRKLSKKGAGAGAGGESAGTKLFVPVPVYLETQRKDSLIREQEDADTQHQQQQQQQQQQHQQHQQQQQHEGDKDLVEVGAGAVAVAPNASPVAGGSPSVLHTKSLFGKQSSPSMHAPRPLLEVQADNGKRRASSLVEESVEVESASEPDIVVPVFSSWSVRKIIEDAFSLVLSITDLDLILKNSHEGREGFSRESLSKERDRLVRRLSIMLTGQSSDKKQQQVVVVSTNISTEAGKLLKIMEFRKGRSLLVRALPLFQSDALSVVCGLALRSPLVFVTSANPEETETLDKELYRLLLEAITQLPLTGATNGLAGLLHDHSDDDSLYGVLSLQRCLGLVKAVLQQAHDTISKSHAGDAAQQWRQVYEMFLHRIVGHLPTLLKNAIPDPPGSDASSGGVSSHKSRGPLGSLITGTGGGMTTRSSVWELFVLLAGNASRAQKDMLKQSIGELVSSNLNTHPSARILVHLGVGSS